MSEVELIAATAFGLEAVTARELAGLGYQGKGVDHGRVLFRTDLTGICRANLWLRSADRVLVRLAEFDATDFGQLFDGTHEIPWEAWLPPDAAFPVNARSQNSQLSSVPACQKIVKKAIVERLRRAHRTSHLPETGASYTVDLVLRRDVATLCLDTTGPSLHKRGYRSLTGAAPLKETLAAALVLLTHWKPGRHLLDPFCGSGTIPIEAAMIGRNLAPGLHRHFAAEDWPAVPAAHWQTARQEARDVALPAFQPRLIGTDIDEAALRLARFHADKAGVADQIHFQRRAFEDLSSPHPFGVLITNPPYGERLGDEAEIHRLYGSLPSVLARIDTWSFFILTSHADLERRLQRAADRRRKLFNGRLECTYYQFLGPKPPRPDVGRDEG